jgi:hypothetical protein
MQLETLVIYKEVEEMFIDGCVEAILQNDTSQTHILQLIGDRLVYKKEHDFEESTWVPSIMKGEVADILYVCVCSQSMIAYLHHKMIQKKALSREIKACVEHFLIAMKQALAYRIINRH